MEKKVKKENIFVSLIFNIVAPVLIMTKLNGVDMLGPVYSLIVALLFPLVYAIYDFILRKNVNLISILGFASVLLTGVFGLFELPPMWIAVKEASVPLIIGIVVLFSVKSEKNLVKKLLFNEDLMDFKKVEDALIQNGKKDELNVVIINASNWVAISFFVSAILNYVLAKIILVSQPGTEEYISELGKMQGLSFPVIAVPCSIILVLVMLYVFKKIKSLTGYGLEDIMKR